MSGAGGARFASASVVKAYVLLLRGYRQNSAHTNHCVAKMLHRIAYDLKMEALLFQLSVFCIFNRLLSDPSATAYKVRGPGTRPALCQATPASPTCQQGTAKAEKRGLEPPRSRVS